MRNPFKLTLEKVIAYLVINADKLDNETAEKIMSIIVKSKANKIKLYKVDDNVHL